MEVAFHPDAAGIRKTGFLCDIEQRTSTAFAYNLLQILRSYNEQS